MERPNDLTENPPSDDKQMVSEAESKVVTSQPEPDGLQKIQLEEKSPIKIKKASKLRDAWSKKWVRITVIVLAILLIIGGITGAVMGITVKKLLVTKEYAKKVSTSIEERNLTTARENLAKTDESLKNAHNTFRKTGVYKYIPLLKGYWNDVDHVFSAGELAVQATDQVLAAIEPYADVLGFTGAEVEQAAQSAEDRVIFIAETAEKLEPEIDNIVTTLKLANDEIAQINEQRYPKSFFKTPVRSQITQFKQVMRSTSESLSQFKPIIGILPELLGNPEPKKYLLLFQNDAELRPTGGFMTAYATLTVTKGKIEAGISQDIYTLDNNFTQKIPAPEPIKKYLPLVYYWNLRDMNLSPDFKISMDTFTEYYNQTPGAPEVDAIIAIDTQVPVRILEILGPIGVSGYGGKFSSENDPRCDCPQVIYELENIITRPTYEVREGRKSILGPLMNSILGNMMGSPKSKWPEFFNIFTESISEKHLMMYFFEEDKQQAVEALQAAGRIVSYDGDYLHINDTNFAGAKSNLFVEQEVIQEITVNDDGSLTKKITLTYRNPAPPSNCNLEAGELCLNGVLRDWIRIYVPQGSELISSKGSEVDVITAEDLGKTVFEGFFTLAPESVKKLEFEYKVPPVINGDYKLLVQNQPGTKIVPHTILLGSEEQNIDIDSDTEIIISR